jgi:hypothetical protein
MMNCCGVNGNEKQSVKGLAASESVDYDQIGLLRLSGHLYKTGTFVSFPFVPFSNHHPSYKIV